MLNVARPARRDSFHPSRGELIEVGGRRLRLVRSGAPSDRPTIILEAGAFGFAADWAVVQAKLAAKGLRSLAYDRAGLGFSDPGPSPRDGRAIAADLEALLARADEPGPYVVVGHSMGGLMVKVFTDRNRGNVLGVVLVDAVTPEILDTKPFAAGVHAFRGAMLVAGIGAKAGLLPPMSLVLGDRIGLDGEAAAEKRRMYNSAGHIRWASEEVQHWPAMSEHARDGGLFDPELPVAVITAGDETFAPSLKKIQTTPALASRKGYVEHVAGSKHASLLGKRFGDPIVRGVEHVLAAAGR